MFPKSFSNQPNKKDQSYKNRTTSTLQTHDMIHKKFRMGQRSWIFPTCTSS